MAEGWDLSHSTGCDAVMLALHRCDVADLKGLARVHLIVDDRLGPVAVDSGDVELRVGNWVLALRHGCRVGIVNGTTCAVLGAALVFGADTFDKEAGHASVAGGRERKHVDAVTSLEPDARPTEDLGRAAAVSTGEQTANDRGGMGL